MSKIAQLVAVLTPREVTDFLPEPHFSEMRALADQFHLIDACSLDTATFHRALAELNPDVLVACWKTPVLPTALPSRLRYTCYLAGSVKPFVTREHLEQGLLVTNWGGSISPIVAEGGLLLVLAALRRAGHWIPAMHRDGAWKTPALETATLFGARVGLHGFGRVARELARLLTPFGVKLGIHAPETDSSLYAAHGAQRVATLEQLFSESDVVIEISPLIPATTGIITEKLLRLIPKGGVFVNIGRGGVVDEEALLRIAREGKLQIGLDVYQNEPLPVDSGFRGLKNVTLLPHIAGPTTDSRHLAGAFSLRNLRAFVAGHPLEAVVTPQIFDASS